jgi:hypothetical protein
MFAFGPKQTFVWSTDNCHSRRIGFNPVNGLRDLCCFRLPAKARGGPSDGFTTALAANIS